MYKDIYIHTHIPFQLLKFYLCACLFKKPSII